MFIIVRHVHLFPWYLMWVKAFNSSKRLIIALTFQVAMCSAYIRIAKTCPPHIWRPEILVNMLCSSEPCLPLIDCFRVAIGILGPNRVGGVINGVSTPSGEGIESSGVGEKRSAQNLDSVKCKRQKVDKETLVSNANVWMQCEPTSISTCDRDNEYADYLRGLLLSFVGLLKPTCSITNPLRPEVALSTLGMLCLVFCDYPHADLSLCILQQMHAWMPWICEQVCCNSFKAC